MEELAPITPSTYKAFITYLDRPQKTSRSHINNLRQFAAYLQKEEILRPTREDVISYRKYLESEHPALTIEGGRWVYRLDRSGRPYMVTCKPATVAGYLQSVRQFFKWTAAAGIYPNIAENIRVPKIRHDEHKKDALQPEDVRTILNDLSARIQAAQTKTEEEQARRIYAVFLLAVTAGLRTVEISRANVRDLEERGGSAWLYVWGKGHSEPDTKKPLAKEVYTAIKDYLALRHYTAASPLFVATGNRAGGQRLASTTISTMLKKAMQASGYDSERLTAHSLRHTTGTCVQGLTGDLYKTQKYMRHDDPRTTEIYLHIKTEEQEADIAEKLLQLYKD